MVFVSWWLFSEFCWVRSFCCFFSLWIVCFLVLIWCFDFCSVVFSFFCICFCLRIVFLVCVIFIFKVVVVLLLLLVSGVWIFFIFERFVGGVIFSFLFEVCDRIWVGNCRGRFCFCCLVLILIMFFISLINFFWV